MIKRTQEEWRTLFQKHEASGLSAIAFCKQHQLCPKYFSLRRKQLLGAPGTVKKKSARFVQAIPAPQPPTQARFIIGELRLELTGYEPKQIVVLVRALA